MRRALVKSLLLTLPLLLVHSAHAGIDLTRNAAGRNAEVLHIAPPARPPLLLRSGGKASARSVLARLKARSDHDSAAMALAGKMLDQTNLRIEKQFEHVPGLFRIARKGPSAQLMDEDSLRQTIKQLRQSGLFDYVEPDWRVHLLTEPTDTAYTDGTLWGLNNSGQNGGTAGIDINVVPAWATTTGSSEVVVGVVDTGIRYTHQDLAANMWINAGEIAGNGLDDDGNGYTDDVYGINAIDGSGDPYDDNDHGTHVAGTIAAAGSNNGAHVGVAFDTRLMALKFLDAGGSGDTSDAIRCIEYAIANGVDILNNSWGGGGFSQALLDAIHAAEDAGVLFVAAAGNASADNDVTASYPSGFEVANIISVAAIDRTGRLAGFSNYGAQSVDLAAPGVEIFSSSASSDTSYAIFSGTSMATPHVAGAAALVRSAHPEAGVTELRNRLLMTATPLAALTGRIVTGGLVNAGAALAVEADGVLEISASALRVEINSTTAVEVSVTDLFAVTDATVEGAFGTGVYQAFSDDGSAPDRNARDGVYTATIPTPATGDVATLNVAVSAPGKQPADLSFNFPMIAPPPNDDFHNRTQIPADQTNTTGSNRLASSEENEPRNPSQAGGNTVWWEWISPTQVGPMTLSTTGSDFDTTLAVYQGESLENLQLVAANDDAGGMQSAVTFTPDPEQSYYLQVDGYAGATGRIQLSSPASSGGPVIFEQPTDVSVRLGGTATLSVGASGSPPLSYQWIRPDNNDMPVTGAIDATLTIDAAREDDAGTYAVIVSNKEGQARSASVFLSVDQIGLYPENDDFSNAEALNSDSGRLIAANGFATGEPSEPEHAGVSKPLNSLWYSWLPPTNGVIRVDTFGSDFDTTLAVYVGSHIEDLLPVAASDDADGTLQSAVSVSVSEDTHYWIAVDGYEAATGQAVINYLFDDESAPENDDFADSLPIGSNETASGRNTNATGEDNEPDHAGVSIPLSSIWWSWTAPSDGEATIHTYASNFDTTLAVYTGTDVSSLTPIAQNDDSDGRQSLVRFEAVQDAVYAIAVDGYGSRQGSISLSVNFASSAPDADSDGIPDEQDNCPSVANSDQADPDRDRVGSACDAFPNDAREWADSDADGVGDNAEIRDCSADAPPGLRCSRLVSGVAPDFEAEDPAAHYPADSCAGLPIRLPTGDSICIPFEVERRYLNSIQAP